MFALRCSKDRIGQRDEKIQNSLAFLFSCQKALITERISGSFLCVCVCFPYPERNLPCQYVIWDGIASWEQYPRRGLYPFSSNIQPTQQEEVSSCTFEIDFKLWKKYESIRIDGTYVCTLSLPVYSNGTSVFNLTVYLMNIQIEQVSYPR